MKRTDIESVLKTLSSKSLTTGDMLQIPEMVNNIMRISTAEAVNDVTNVILDDYGTLDIGNKDDKQVALRIIIENIARFYPISRNLVIAIVKKIQLSDHFLLNGIDAGGIALKQINNIFSDLRGSNNTLTRFSNEYSIRLSDLEDKKKQYDELKNRLEYVREEKLRLENELCNINRQAEIEQQEQEVEFLKNKLKIERDNIEINKLKRQKEILLDELKILENDNEYKKISSEIHELKDKINSIKKDYDDKKNIVNNLKSEYSDLEKKKIYLDNREENYPNSTSEQINEYKNIDETSDDYNEDFSSLLGFVSRINGDNLSCSFDGLGYGLNLIKIHEDEM